MSTLCVVTATSFTAVSVDDSAGQLTNDKDHRYGNDGGTDNNNNINANNKDRNSINGRETNTNDEELPLFQ